MKTKSEILEMNWVDNNEEAIVGDYVIFAWSPYACSDDDLNCGIIQAADGKAFTIRAADGTILQFDLNDGHWEINDENYKWECGTYRMPKALKSATIEGWEALYELASQDEE